MTGARFEWMALDGAGPTAMEPGCGFVDTAWISAWQQAFVPGRGWRGPIRLACLVGEGGQRLAFVPLARQQIGPVHVTSLAGYYWPSRGVALAGGRPQADSMADGLTRHKAGPMLRWGPVSADDAGTQALIAALVGRGWTCLRRKLGLSFVLELPPSVAELKPLISPSLLKNIKYLRRRLEAQCGALQLTRHSLGPENVEAVVARAASIESRSWVAGGSGEPKFVGAANQHFWTTLARGRPVAEPVVWILSAGSDDIAFSVHIEAADTVWIVANSFDERWKPFSPGSILTHEVLLHAVANGRRRVDWGQGDSGYKSRWGAQPTTAIDDVLLFRPGPAGRLLCRLARAVSPQWRAG